MKRPVNERIDRLSERGSATIISGGRKGVEKESLRSQRFPGYEGAFLAIKAPEGTMLYVFDEDFLGEPIEVDEDVDPDEFPTPG